MAAVPSRGFTGPSSRMGPLTAGEQAVQLVAADESLCIPTEGAFLEVQRDPMESFLRPDIPQPSNSGLG